MPSLAGLVLAAGAGRRMGTPKALLRGEDGVPWSARAASLLRDAGCEPVLVVLGAAAEEARTLLPAWATPVLAADWADGVGASLRAGLDALAATDGDAVLVTLVDLPDARVAAARRVVAAADPGAGDSGPLPGTAAPGGSGAQLDPSRVRRRAALARAVYDGVPGHPVLIGRDHWGPLAAVLHGDLGAGPYLRANAARPVDCSDLGGGEDQDTRP